MNLGDDQPLMMSMSPKVCISPGLFNIQNVFALFSKNSKGFFITAICDDLKLI